MSILAASATAIIDLTAQLNLPKGTEHFVSDLHGEEGFSHVLRKGSGSIRRRIDEMFAGTLADSDRRNLATLIYCSDRKLPLILQTVVDEDALYRETLVQLLQICRSVISK